jgi:hypothetical protein
MTWKSWSGRAPFARHRAQSIARHCSIWQEQRSICRPSSSRRTNRRELAAARIPPIHDRNLPLDLCCMLNPNRTRDAKSLIESVGSTIVRRKRIGSVPRWFRPFLVVNTARRLRTTVYRTPSLCDPYG